MVKCAAWLLGFAGFPGWLGGGAQVGSEERQAAERKLLNVSQLERKRWAGEARDKAGLAYTLMGRADVREEEGKSRNMHTRCTPVRRLALITDIHRSV